MKPCVQPGRSGIPRRMTLGVAGTKDLQLSTAEQIDRKKMHEHEGSVLDLISVLEEKLPASSIMTPWSRVDRVSGESNTQVVVGRAKELMDKWQYSGVPLISSGGVQGLYFRCNPTNSPRYEGARSDHFVDDGLGLIELIRRLRDTQKVVVIVGTPELPVGLLTYADFSKRPFRILLFTIVAEVEYLLAATLERIYPDDSWIDLLQSTPDGISHPKAELIKRKGDAKSWDTTMPLTTFAVISHLIAAVGASPQAIEMLGETANLANQLRSLPDLRNRVAHVVKPVVAGPKEIKSIADQIDLLLGWVERWSKRLMSRA